MKRILLFLVLILSCLGINAEPLVPINLELLKQLKADYQKHDAKVEQMVALYQKAAEKMMKAEAPTITMKTKLPPSNDKRDYISLSRYWWPDPSKKDGLPYIRRDGVVNPEIHDFADIDNGDKMLDAVELLSILYYVTDNEIYAQHCTRYLRAWFTDPKTGMNPNMVFAQFIPGQTVLRGTGLLDGRRFAEGLCLSQLIEGSASWSKTDQQKLHDWGNAYCYWYENSTQGQKEHQATNNHGIWYDITHLMLRSFLGDRATVTNIIKSDICEKLDAQIAADGSLPKELERTLSLHYSTFVMEALTMGNYIARQLGFSIWSMETKSGKSAAQCLKYLYPYYLNPTKWPHKQIKPFEVDREAVILYESGTDLNNTDYLKQAEKVGVSNQSKEATLLPYYKMRK